MNYITFNGIPSWDTTTQLTNGGLRIHVAKYPDYEMPERDYEEVHIPGRNGDLIFDTGTYKNVERKYEIWSGPEAGDFKTLASKISKWLHPAKKGFVTLTDTYEPYYYRKACYLEDARIANQLNEAGSATISFLCKPQRFYIGGLTARECKYESSQTDQDRYRVTSNVPEDTVRQVTSGTTARVYFYNTTGQDALPTITVTPDSAERCRFYMLNANESTKTIELNFTVDQRPIVIDSSIQDCYSLDTNGNFVNRNNDVTLPNYEFPVFPGNVSYTYVDVRSTSHCKLEVIPNWFII